VRCLFGYKVDMQVSAPGSLQGALVVLRPEPPAARAVAPPGDRDPQLQFRFTAATGRLELLPTPLGRVDFVRRSAAALIEGAGSVPWFTGNLMSDLCQKSTAGPPGGGGGG
jgi:hypothetical protein